MVYERRAPRRSADDRLVGRFTHRESAVQRARRIARTRITIPKEVVQEFEQQLSADTARQARAIAAHLTHTPQEIRTMATTKRNATTKRAEPTPAPAKPEPTKKPKAGTKAKAAKKAKATDRSTILARYMAAKLKIQKRVKIGAVITYHGRNETIDGKPVKVVEYESRGGIWVEHRDTRYVVSPHALLKK